MGPGVSCASGGRLRDKKSGLETAHVHTGQLMKSASICFGGKGGTVGLAAVNGGYGRLTMSVSSSSEAQAYSAPVLPRAEGLAAKAGLKCIKRACSRRGSWQWRFSVFRQCTRSPSPRAWNTRAWESWAVGSPGLPGARRPKRSASDRSAPRGRIRREMTDPVAFGTMTRGANR